MKDTIISEEFDNIGTYTESIPPNSKVYNFRKMLAYCSAHDKTVTELSEKEKEQFAV